MPILYLHDKIYDTLKDNEITRFLKACDNNGIRYLQINDTSWQLLPELIDKSFIVKSLVKEARLKDFVHKLDLEFSRYGASIINEYPNKVSPKIFTSTSSQISLLFTENTTLPENSDLILYYSLRHKEATMKFIGRLAKHLNHLTDPLTYNIATYWKHLTSLKYFKSTYAQIPAVIIEFNNVKISELTLQDLTDCIIKSVIGLYGTESDLAEIQQLEECMAKAGRKIAVTKQIRVNKPEVKPKISKGRKSIVLQPDDLAKVNSTTRKRRSGNTSSFRLPSNSLIRYFPRLGGSVSSPFLQNYTLQSINKSTFNRTAPVTQGRFDEVSTTNKTRSTDSDRVAENETRERGSFQSLKDLKRILDK